MRIKPDLESMIRALKINEETGEAMLTE